MWFRFSRRTRRLSAVRSHHFQPQVDVLEDRCLLNAGALDTTFGGTGVVTTSLKGGAVAQAVVIQPWDGKIVVEGHSGSKGSDTLARYNPDGSLDSTFGSGGIAVSSLDGGRAIALYSSTDTTGNAKKIVQANGGALVRFNANGSIDTSFGKRGTVTVAWTIAGVVIQPDGKIVVDGFSGSASELARFNANGTLDTSFGSGGTVTLAGGFIDYQSLLLQPDGKLVVGGENNVGPNSTLELELARVNANGTLDTTFNSAGPNPGIVTAALANPYIDDVRLALYPSTGTDTADFGKIVAAATIGLNPGGINNEQVTLARFSADGTADNTFGQGGQVVTPFPNSGSMAWATALQADGKIVVAGNTISYGGGSWNFSLLRYNPDGSLDTTFSNSSGQQVFPSGGLVMTPDGTPDGRALAVAIQADGRIVAAGATDFATSSSEFMVARYLPGPEIGTFTASASTVTAGNSLTLTASNVSDGDPSSANPSQYATVTQVAFYAVDTSGNQYLLGNSTLSNGVWSPVNYTVSLSSGSYTLFAQATDSDDTIGDAAFLTLTVQ
jgi:uncharacterized delta-60 repeat protein